MVYCLISQLFTVGLYCFEIILNFTSFISIQTNFLLQQAVPNILTITPGGTTYTD